MSAREKRVIAYHEAGHALVGHVVPNGDPIHKVSIVSRGRALGWTLALPEEDRILHTRSQLLDQLAMLLGGRCAEELVFGDPTTGAQNDIERATQIARSMVTQWGMSTVDRPGAARLSPTATSFVGRDGTAAREYSESVATRIDDEVARLVSEAQAAGDRRSCAASGPRSTGWRRRWWSGRRSTSTSWRSSSPVSTRRHRFGEQHRPRRRIRPMRPTGDPGPPVIMGVVNVTPDSFSDGGRWFDPDAAVAHGLDLVAEGATVIDVGGESTRPFAAPVDPAEEQRRVLPVIRELAPHVRVSIDTRNAETADGRHRRRGHAGERRVGHAWPRSRPTPAWAGWRCTCRAIPRTMQVAPAYDDVVGRGARLPGRSGPTRPSPSASTRCGSTRASGSARRSSHNLALLGHLDDLVATGYPVAVGLSRKGFLGRLVGGVRCPRRRPAAARARAAARRRPAPVPADDRLEASVATAVWALAEGARMVRVHDVAAHRAGPLRLLAASSPAEASWSAA